MKDDIIDILHALGCLAGGLLVAYALSAAFAQIESLESDAAALAKLPTVTRGGGL
jgi:hypothetical protein